MRFLTRKAITTNHSSQTFTRIQTSTADLSGAVETLDDTMTAILGISAFYHDSAAAIVVDGKIVAAAQEERFTRKKHDWRFPSRAIEYCLQEASLQPDQLDYVGFYDKPLLKFDHLLETYLAYAPTGLQSFLKAMPLWLGQKLHLPREMSAGLGGAFQKRYVFLEHHQSHAASAFLASPFASYVSGHTLVVDGANWQRRAMLQPEFTPIREQLGKGPFEL